MRITGSSILRIGGRRYSTMKYIIFIIMISLFSFSAWAITNGCDSEVDPASSCVIRTPPLACANYTSIYNASNNLVNFNFTTQEIVDGTGIFNFTFSPNGTGIYTIVLCDNTSTSILVRTTVPTDLATILSNQATLQDNIETVNQTVKDINVSITATIGKVNLSIIENLSNDFGFFDPLLNILNLSILINLSNSLFSSSVTSADTVIIGRECARQSLGANVTIAFGYNKSNFALINSTYNYTGLGIFINETYHYDNESFLINTTRRNHLE